MDWKKLPWLMMVAVLVAGSAVGAGSVSSQPFGTLADGRAVHIYTLTNNRGVEARIMNYGGIVVSLKVPDRNGLLGDVVLGYDNLSDYLKATPYFGAIIGRCANRVARGKFTLNGVEYMLTTNSNGNHSHGGLRGFDKVVWDVKVLTNRPDATLELKYVSPAGEEGYPGELSVTVVYSLTEKNELCIEFAAMADKPTVCNLTHHSYFNLAGQGDILNHEVMISADAYTPVDKALIPTGEVRPVEGTPFDFRKATAIGARIKADDEQLKYGRGYDHNWVIKKPEGMLAQHASVYEPVTGRIMDVFSTEPGLQFYSGNFLDGTNVGKGGVAYQYRSGFCLEPQHYPDSPNHPHFPTVVLTPGQTYRNTIIYRFSVAQEENVTRIIEGFESRRQRALQKVAEFVYPPRSTYGDHIYGVKAIANLALGRDQVAANAGLREVAAWYQLPHPTGRDHRGECDFAALKLCLAFHHPTVSRNLEPETRTAIRRFFLTERFDSMHNSENHVLIFRVSRHLMAQALADETFAQYASKGAALAAEDRDWLIAFLRFRAERGWGEFDSACYFVPDWEALTCLRDYTRDPELRRLTGMMLDLLLADMAVDSLNGMYCGAQGRIYTQHALNHARELTYPLQYLYFGLGDPARLCPIDALLSDYRPHPLVVDIALNRPTAYENRERKHLHKLSDVRPLKPLEGSIRKYTWYTPAYIMGCVQYQDPYPVDTGGDRWYAHHQQHEWDLTFGTRTDARLFTHHPGDNDQHNYWTGDFRCGCGHFFQHRTVVLSLYDIPTNQPYQFIHAYVPRAAFDEIREKEGTLCVRAGQVYAALRFADGYEWVQKGEYAGREVISRSGRTAVACEVGLAGEFSSFDAFCAEVVAARMDFDRTALSLTYHSRRTGTIMLDGTGMRKINGQPADLNYATYDCPYLRSAWKSGVVEIMKGERKLLLDFRTKR